jgi:hypothetical protein
MASNLKGQGGIKRLLLQHGEKIVIALVGVVAIFLIYKTASLPRLKEELQASKLQEQISQTSSAVRNAKWPDPQTDPELAKEVFLATGVGVKADNGVDAKAFEISKSGFDPVPVSPSVLRTDPVLINAQDVRATGGSGLLAFVDEQIRKAQELKIRARADELAKKENDRLEKEQKEAQKNPEGQAAGRRGKNGEAMEIQPFDPDHPDRRAVENLAAGAGLGIPRQGGERIERAYWACVVAKVPIREQLKLFQDAFETARGGFDPSRDFPQYKGFMVQRAEVIPGKPLEWKPVPLFDAQHKSVVANKPISKAPAHGIGNTAVADLYTAAGLYWPGMSPDVIDPRFADQVLTLPLPPLVGRDWGAEASHPDIPLLADTPPLEEEVVPVPEAVPLPGAQPSDGDSFSSVNPATANPAMGFPQPGGRGPGMPGMMNRGPGMMMGRGEMGGRMMMGGRGGEEGGGRAMGGGMGMTGTARTSLPKGVDHLLLRFFDFTVEPGKKYKYQVKLVLADPNASILDTMNMLAPEVLDRRRKETVKGQPRREVRFIEAWSDPSLTVGIPLAGNTRLVDVKVPTAEKFNDEPSANLLVESFDVDAENNAIQAANKKELRRGNVANFIEDAEYLGGEMQPWIDKKKGFKFETGMTLLDVEGGKKLTKDYVAPGRVMLMGSAGELYIRNELDDKPAVEYHDMIFRKDKHRLEGAEGFGPEGGGRMPRGPGRGGGRGAN